MIHTHTHTHTQIYDLPCQILNILARNDAQNEQIGNSVGAGGFFSNSLAQRRLSLVEPAEMKLGDGLADECAHRFC